MADMFSKKHLLIALAKAGLPHSYVTLVGYERRGVISKPKSAIGFGNGKWRFYSSEDIAQIVNEVKQYRHNIRRPQATNPGVNTPTENSSMA